jgi:Flp pilus assembly protein TadG
MSINLKARMASAANRMLRRLDRDERGVAAIEFAMIVPIMFFLFVGAVEFSQAITVDRRVTQIASSTADLIAREKTLTTGQMTGIMGIINHLVKPYDQTKLKLTVTNVRAAMASATNTTVCWSHNHNGGVQTYAPGQSYVLPTGIVEAGNSVIVAEVRYEYEPLIFKYFIATAFPLEETFYLKPRLASFVRYNDINC